MHAGVMYRVCALAIISSFRMWIPTQTNYFRLTYYCYVVYTYHLLCFLLIQKMEADKLEQDLKELVGEMKERLTVAAKRR